MKTMLSIIMAMLAISCASLLPQKRSEAAAVKTADSVANRQSASFERVLETGVRVPTVFWDRTTGSNMPVVQAPYARETTSYKTDSDTTAGSSESAQSRFKVSLPLGVTIGLLAIALLVLLYAVKAWRKESAAADAAFRLGDAAAASAIQNVESLMSSETDPAKITQLQAHARLLEKERGKLNRQRKPTP